MTRFARARGSKASNEKAPEDGTPWEIMKEQLEKAKKETEESKKRQEAENKRIDNYEKFLKEQKTQKRKSTWCDFPDVQQKKKTVDSNAAKPQNKSEGTEIKNTKSKKKKQKNKEVEETATDAPTIDETKTKNKMPKEIKESSNETTVVLPKNIDTTHLEPKENKKKKNNKKVEHNNTKEASISAKVPQQSNKIEEKTHQQQNGNYKEKPKNNAQKQPKKNYKNKLMDGQPNRRKPVDDGHFQLMINGKDVKLVRFDGFPIMERDAERIGELRQSMLKKGIPKSEIQRTIKLERRRAEKALARMKKDVCYNCRKGGHNLSDCPDLKSKIPGVDAAADGMCFKCGSTEHRQFECKVQRDKEFRFATCFICKEPGHIARQCPDNPKGLYPNGGACKLCGDVTHLRKDCPTVMDKKEEKSIKLSTLDNMDSLEDIEQTTQQNKVSQEGTKKPKKIKF